MIYLILAIIGCSGMSLLLKIAEEKCQSYYGLMCINYFAAAVFAFLTISEKRMLLHLPGNILKISFITGVIYLLVLILCRYNISINGAILATTFMQLGVLVPVLLAVLLWKETMTGIQIAGSVVSLIAICMISYQSDREKKDSILMLLLLLIIAIQ